MSEALRVATVRRSEDLPFAMDLELRIEDRDVIAALANYAEGPERDEYAREALKIGVLALRRASSALDGEFIQRETTRLLDSLRRSLDEHSRGAYDRLNQSLKDYFDPQDGRFTQRVQCLTAADGDLAKLLSSQLDGEDSRLARTLLHHLGENSPLLKWLSPDQSQGLLAALRSNVEVQLQTQRERLLREFSLDNADGALSRLIKELNAKHGDLSQDLQKKIDVVIKEFSLDEENSALSRLVRNVDRAQRTITSEFSLDNEQSALRRLRSELTTILDAHVKSNAEFQEEVKTALGKLVTRREAELRSTTHGATFQNAVYEFVDRLAQRRGDIVEDTGNGTGLIKNCKVGDAVLTLGADCVAAGARIVFEAKEVDGYSFRKALEEIELARKNRDAQLGVFVFSKRTAPATLEPLSRHDCDVFVVWDAEDPATDVFLQAAIDVSRALCIRQLAGAARAKVDFEPIDRALLDIEKRVSNYGTIKSSAERIGKASSEILERVRIDAEALEKQLATLRESISSIRLALGETASAEDALDA